MPPDHPAASSPDGHDSPTPEAIAQLTELPNIGPVLAAKLIGIGVTSPEGLTDLGAVAAARALSTPADPACYNMLYALAGAIAGVRWHDLPAPERKALHDELWADR